jgi:signal transduction histidine kinase
MDRAEWEKASRLTGHRVRSAIQSIKSQLRILESERKGGFGSTAAAREAAEKDLVVAFRDLEGISYAAESNIRGAVDVKSVRRELVPMLHIVQAAVEAQQDLADTAGIEIEISDGIRNLPQVWVNPTLLRFAFINLINNGLKYSYPHPANRKRVLRIRPALADAGKVAVEVENFGLGIMETDRERIFEWGVRLSEDPVTFRSVYGKGIGLWETKHIVEGHGGEIHVRSVHFSKAPVAYQNIEQCITVFTVVLPRG